MRLRITRGESFVRIDYDTGTLFMQENVLARILPHAEDECEANEEQVYLLESLAITLAKFERKKRRRVANRKYWRRNARKKRRLRRDLGLCRACAQPADGGAVYCLDHVNRRKVERLRLRLRKRGLTDADIECYIKMQEENNYNQPRKGEEDDRTNK